MKNNIHSHPLIVALKRKGEIQDEKIGWGYKASGQRAINSGKDFIVFEDGFIRSLFPGYQQGMPFSIVTDKAGIYYDAKGESDLIKFLNGQTLSADRWNNQISKNFTKFALERIQKSGVSKYNCYLNRKREKESGILVVDQTAGDASIQYSGMSSADFDRMLHDAINENPDSPIYVKAHPDHEYRQKHSCFTPGLLDNKNITILPRDMPSAEALSFCHSVYVGSSLLGMEGLIHSRKVITYGWNFYSGWGLTEDRASSTKPPREKAITLEHLFEAAYLRYTQYFDPDTLELCDIHRVIDHIELQWRHWQRGTGDWISYGLSPWKKQLLPKYLGPKLSSIYHKIKPDSLASRAITWGAKSLPNELSHLPLTRIEDGFIRSRGLGAHFNFPLSWVFDDLGIYFDARSPSRLENLLEKHKFSDPELEQAEELIDYLKVNKLTKYNLGIKEVTLPVDSAGKKVILIPGQVDSDASIEFGSPKLRNNRELLAEVRCQNPEAYICYKPHPDLLSGARKDAPLWEGIEQDVDHLVLEGDIISWIQVVDEVHTLTSTVGFEALIHGKPVHTYGIPFYAGWGLTNDWIKCNRRTTKRNLTELACAALILYPTYLNPKTGEFTTALNAAKILINPEFNHDSRSGFLKILGKVKSWYNKLRR